jgi:hypothetical protein
MPAAVPTSTRAPGINSVRIAARRSSPRAAFRSSIKAGSSRRRSHDGRTERPTGQIVFAASGPVPRVGPYPPDPTVGIYAGPMSDAVKVSKRVARSRATAQKRVKATPIAQPQNRSKRTKEINGLQTLKVTRSRTKFIPCDVCEKPIKQTGRRKTLCSTACKQRAYRTRARRA